jgi:signal transduction histidine kinase
VAQFSLFIYKKIIKMIKSYHLLLQLILCLCCLTAAHAQDGQLPEPVTIIIDSYKSVQELPQPGWVIKEGNIPLTIHDLLQGNFKDGQLLAIDPDEKIIEHFERYWFALEFISEVDLYNWLLHVENKYAGFGFINNFSEIRSYAVQDGQIAGSGITGFFVPASERDFEKRHTQSLLNLSLSSGSRMTLWVHINKNYTLTTNFPRLSIYDPSITLPDFTLQKRDMLLFGSFIMIWILSVIMYFFLKDKISLWFSVFMTALIVDNLTAWSADPLTPLLYPENPIFGLYIGMATSTLMVVSLLQFSRVFINLPVKYRKLDKIISAAIWVLLFSNFFNFHLALYFKNITFNMGFMLVYGTIYVGSGTTYLFLKDPLSKFIGLAMLLFIIPQLIPLPFDDKYLTYSGLLLTMTSGVAYRIKILFQDRLQAEKEKKDLLMHQNKMLEIQVDERTAELNDSLHELKATQSQLIQQEKLAYLGQLTAGIAHEIKNPLNFVNNFSEVSIEMIEEVLEERSKSKETREETLLDELLEDIRTNINKIHEHGSRANGIVTSMLLHSRGGSGKKEPTGLNDLIREYVNLCFHGMRAGKNPINVDIELDLDPEIKYVPLIKDDFTRVIINLCNNAFDAMKKKSLELVEYFPKLNVITAFQNNHILIEVTDNGSGIPDEIKDKILQPFFTTKKGTEGTGLGLSITHDIIKAHGGELGLETSLNNGTTFIIKLIK